MSEQVIVNTGFLVLDKILTGFHSGGVYIIAGEEKSGKSSLALNFVKYFVESGYAVYFASTELRSGEVDGYLDTISGTECWRKTNPGLTIQDIGTGTLARHLGMIRQEVANCDTKIVVVDNLTSYRDQDDLGGKEWERISQAGDSYRRLAKELDVLLLMVLHLNQGTRLNEVPKSVKDLIQLNNAAGIFDESVSVYRCPTKDDLKGGSGFRSQTFGQLLLWRPYQGFNSYELNKLSCVIVENNRYGPTGKVRFDFDGKTKKFTEVEPGYDDTYERAKQIFIPDEDVESSEGV